MVRLILSILAAFVVTGILSTAVDHIFHITDVYPPYGAPFFDTGLLLLASSYRFIFQIAGAYVAGMVAREQTMKSVWIIGILGVIAWLGGTYFNQDLGPVWYGVVGAALSIPSTLIGGKLYLSRQKT